jgi:phosphoglycolate phosphatase-like HAD superfamily hydrolase
VIALFDLDSTLLRLAVNREVLAEALDIATGVPGLLDRIDFNGHTDRWLCTEAARVAGLATEGLYARYERAYTEILRAALATLPDTALPGAAALLAALAARDDVVLGLATGNTRRNAALKLAHAGLDAWFGAPPRGGFGDVHEERADLVRAGARACGHVDGDRLVVVGDTVHDVRGARAAGAVAVAVATGHVSVDELRAAGAESALPSLEHTAVALAAVIGV